MKYISLLLSFLILSTPVFGQVNETWKASTFTLPGLGVLTKAELYRLQGVTSNVQGQLDLKELLSNKATSLSSPDNTKYPTTQAVSTGLSTGLALKEDTANKATSLASPDNVKFPTTQAVATGLGLKQDTITGAASTITTSNLSTSKAMVTDGSGKAAASSTVDTTELGYLDGVTSPLQTQINTNSTNISGKVSGPASATDEAVARYDLTTGKLIQDSKVSIDDNGLLTTLGSSGAGIYNQGKDFISIFGDGAVTTGSNATLDVTNAGAAIAVANSSLVSISNITPIPSAPVRRFTLVNNTGNSITIVNDTTTGVASTGIYTGTGQDITIGNKASVTFLWNNTRWGIVGGSGSGSGGVGDLDVAFYQDFESAKLTDFTQTGLTIDATSAVHLKKSALLTHNASVIQSFKQVQSLDPKFRGKNLSLKVDCKSTATTGNVTVSVFDETNSTTLLASTQLACSTSIDSYYASFDTASTTASVSYTVSALVQSGSPTTYVDDIVAYITKLSRLSSSITVPKAVKNSFSAKMTSAGVISDEDSEFISGNCSIVASRYVCPFSVALVSTPTCTVTNNYKVNFTRTPEIYNPTTSSTQLTFQFRDSSNALVNDTDATIFCEKTGGDYKDPLTSTESKSIQLTQSALVQTPDSYFKVDGILGLASSNTSVVRLNSANIRSNIGNDVTYASSASLGDSWTINSDATYTINYSFYGQVSNNVTAALTKNGSQLSTNPQSFTNESEALDYGEGDTDSTTRATVKLSWTGPLKATDVIRIQQGNALTANSALTNFSIAKQGSLKQTNINTNSKIKIPTSELRFEGASALGSTDTAIVKYTLLTKLRGDAFSINPNGTDSTLGTHVKMNKDCLLTVTASIYSAVSAQHAITLNQSVRTAWNGGANSEILNSEFANSNDESGLAWSGLVKKDDIIRISSNAAVTTDAGNSLNFICQEQDIQVSVSNTLPQYSESDTIVRGMGNSGQAITATVTNIPFTTVSDTTGGNWNGSQFTVPETGTISIRGSVYYTSSASRYYDLYVDGSLYRRITDTVLSSLINFSITDSFTRGQVLSIREESGSAGGTLNSTLPSAHWITITKVGKPNVTGVDVTPFVNIPVMDSQSSYLSAGSFANTTISGSQTETAGSGIYTYNSTTGVYTVLKNAVATLTFNAKATSAATVEAQIQKNGVVKERCNTQNNIGYNCTTSYTAKLIPNDTFQFAVLDTSATNNISVTLVAAPDTIVTPTESFSTDVANLNFKTSAVTSTDAVGTFSTYSYTSSSNTRTVCATAPSQSLDSMKVDGIQLFSRAYNAPSTCASPSRIEIQMGKGFKGWKTALYKSAGKSIAGTLRYYVESAVEYGAYYNDYNEVTGIMTVDLGATAQSTNTVHSLSFEDNSFASSGYVVINASKTPTLSGISYVSPRVAVISDVKPNATDGGTSTSLTWVQRVLNTIDDPSSFVTFGTNTFTLPAGEYFFEGSAPAMASTNGRHRTRLKNVTANSTALVGTSEFCSVTTLTTRSQLSGKVVITVPTQFQLETWVTTGVASQGLGVASSSGENEIYSQLKITKVK